MQEEADEKGIDDTSILHLHREIDETSHKATNSIINSLFFLKLKNGGAYNEDDDDTETN